MYPLILMSDECKMNDEIYEQRFTFYQLPYKVNEAKSRLIYKYNFHYNKK